MVQELKAWVSSGISPTAWGHVLCVDVRNSQTILKNWIIKNKNKKQIKLVRSRWITPTSWDVLFREFYTICFFCLHSYQFCFVLLTFSVYCSAWLRSDKCFHQLMPACRRAFIILHPRSNVARLSAAAWLSENKIISSALFIGVQLTIKLCKHLLATFCVAWRQ